MGRDQTQPATQAIQQLNQGLLPFEPQAMPQRPVSSFAMQPNFHKQPHPPTSDFDEASFSSRKIILTYLFLCYSIFKFYIIL